MKKSLKITALVIGAFVVGMSINNIALSEIGNGKIAVIDLQKVVTSSNQVKSLKNEQQKKMLEIKSFVEKARKDVAATKDEKQKKNLEAKYNKELNAKTSAIEKDYASKLKNIDKSISATIASEAKAKNYNIVLSKGVVLYGGDDITDAIAKKVK